MHLEKVIYKFDKYHTQHSGKVEVEKKIMLSEYLER